MSGCSWGSWRLPTCPIMPSGCQHTQSARQLPENQARAKLRAPNPIGRVKGPVRIRSASPRRTRPWLADCGDRWRPGWQPRWYNEPPPPPPSLVRGQNNPTWSRDDATGCFHMNHSSRSILPVVSATSGENVLIKFTEPNLREDTWEPGKLAVHFTHTVNEVERALQSHVNTRWPEAGIVLMSPSSSDGRNHVLTLCRAQSTFQLGILITWPGTAFHRYHTDGPRPWCHRQSGFGPTLDSVPPEDLESSSDEGMPPPTESSHTDDDLPPDAESSWEEDEIL